MALFNEWDNFYVVIGSSAAALTGLQFVVMALIADLRPPGTMREIDAFGTPTIVHFGAVLLLSGIMTAPWHRLGPPAVLLATCGVTGVVYTVLVARRARRQMDYTPVFEDWLFHVVLPGASYVLLAVAAIDIRLQPARALFPIGGVGLLLLFVGIHNAWDTVTYVVIARGGDRAAGTPVERGPRR